MTMAQYCLQPHCGTLVASGYCRAHTRAREADRGTRHERGYTYRWDVAAARFRAQYYLCGMRPQDQRPVMSQCFEEGRVTLAEVVDHVVPHRGDAALRWDQIGNWQALCRACHKRKTRAGL